MENNIIDQINKLNASAKETIISIAVLMPFWYIDLYMFKREFFLNSPIQIPIIMSFCLATGNLLSYIIVDIIKYRNVKNKPKYYYHISECIIAFLSATLVQYMHGERNFNYVLYFCIGWPMLLCLLWWIAAPKGVSHTDTIHEHYDRNNNP